MQEIPHIRINLLNKNLSQEERQLLYYLNQKSPQGLYLPNTEYLSEVHFGIDKQQYNISLSHALAVYQAKDKTCYAVFQINEENKLGKGTFNDVYKVKRIIILDSHHKTVEIKKKLAPKRLAVRIRKPDLSDLEGANNPIESFKEAIKKEYKLNKKALHLAIKKPLIINDHNINYIRGISIMRRLENIVLSELIKNDQQNLFLTTDQRLILTKNFYVTLKKQIHDQHVVHRDIKPENVMVDFSNPLDPIFNFFDLDLSVDEDFLDDEAVGTKAYVAPEVFDKDDFIDKKSDIFSSGRTTGQIWRATIGTEFCDNYKFPNMFNDINDLDTNHKKIIKDIHFKMADNKKENRPNIQVMINAIERIQMERHFSKLKDLYSKLKIDKKKANQLNDKDIRNSLIEAKSYLISSRTTPLNIFISPILVFKILYYRFKVDHERKNLKEYFIQYAAKMDSNNFINSTRNTNSRIIRNIKDSYHNPLRDYEHEIKKITKRNIFSKIINPQDKLANIKVRDQSQNKNIKHLLPSEVKELSEKIQRKIHLQIERSDIAKTAINLDYKVNKKLAKVKHIIENYKEQQHDYSNAQRESQAKLIIKQWTKLKLLAKTSEKLNVETGLTQVVDQCLSKIANKK